MPSRPSTLARSTRNRKRERHVLQIKALLDPLKPIGRALKYHRLFVSAVRAADNAGSFDRTRRPPSSFVIGCGRSGTTILGKTLDCHPEVAYRFEPYHSWAAIDPRTDIANLYVATDEARCILGADQVDDRIRRRFDAVFLPPRAGDGTRHVIEKTPINAMRIGYLRAIEPGARFVHIVRDGADVARSIDRVATTGRYRIAGKPAFNQWWGVHDSKWRFLVRDGKANDYYADEVVYISTHLQRGAYEWLVSLREVDRHRSTLGDALHELTYEQLTRDPMAALRGICVHLGVCCEAEWLARAASLIRAGRPREPETVQLPPRMAEDFNGYQVRFGFSGRAAPIDRSGAIAP